jgi:hypothetical protein
MSQIEPSWRWLGALCDSLRLCEKPTPGQMVFNQKQGSRTDAKTTPRPPGRFRKLTFLLCASQVEENAYENTTNHPLRDEGAVESQ